MVKEDKSTNKKNITNKIFLGIFLSIAISALILKIIDGILLDLGWDFNGVEGIHLNFWMNEKNYDSSIGGPLDPSGNLYYSNEWMLAHHPSTLWLLTQFTWITTLIIIVFLFFRFFRYDESIPRWMKWIMTQRTLSLVAMYDSIVSVVFWAGMFSSFDESFIGSLRNLELTITILVHAIVPIFMLFYSLTYLIRDKKASILKEMFVIKGMIYPMLYISYYVLISIIWSDPYEITSIHERITDGKNLTSQIWTAILALFGAWTLLGLMILFHNITLLKFNKQYDPEKDYEISQYKQRKIEKIKRHVIKKIAKEQRQIKK